MNFTKHEKEMLIELIEIKIIKLRATQRYGIALSYIRLLNKLKEE